MENSKEELKEKMDEAGKKESKKIRTFDYDFTIKSVFIFIFFAVILLSKEKDFFEAIVVAANWQITFQYIGIVLSVIFIPLGFVLGVFVWFITDFLFPQLRGIKNSIHPVRTLIINAIKKIGVWVFTLWAFHLIRDLGEGGVIDPVLLKSIAWKFLFVWLISNIKYNGKQQPVEKDESSEKGKVVIEDVDAETKSGVKEINVNPKNGEGDNS